MIGNYLKAYWLYFLHNAVATCIALFFYIHLFHIITELKSSKLGYVYVRVAYMDRQ